MPKNMKLDYGDIDDYIRQQPVDTRDQLNELRALIKELAPEATEHISYGMPTFKCKKVLVHFGVQKNHIGFYPGPAPIERYQSELTPYSTSKGTVRFNSKEPLPLELISKMVKYKLTLIS